MSTEYDVIVIGGGPGGYVGAIRAAQLGLKVACIDKRGTMGGTCLNVGCIPSKALLESSEHYHQAASGMEEHGVKLGKVSLDLKAMMKRKEDVVDSLTKGIEGLLKKNKIDFHYGTATIKGAKNGANEVSVMPNGKKKAETLKTKNIIIATGSEVASLPGIEIDEKRVVSSTGALDLKEVPKHLVVIGGGYIGLEMGSVWQRLGSKVTVVEFLDRITPGMDGEVSKQFKRILEKQGMEFKLGTKVTGAKASKSGVELTVEPAKGGKEEKIKADTVLVSVGRRPYTDGLGLDEAGVTRDERGFIMVDDHFQTNIPGIYAIGDVIPGPMLAHKAEEEGVAAMEIISGQSGHVNYNAIPGVVYTWPEVASVGLTEEQLKDENVPYKVGKFPFMANSRGRAVGQTDGFVKILEGKNDNRILGVHIIGPHAGTMIAEAVLAMEYAASAEDIARTCHAHPTLNEAVKEAALAVDGRVVHM